MILVLWMLSFHSLLSLSAKGPLVSLCFLWLKWCHLHIWGYWYFSQQSWFQLVLHPDWHFSRCSINSVQFSHPVLSNTLQPRESQHARPPCPSPTPRVYPSLCPSSQWCHPSISSSVVPFSSSQTLSTSGSFPMRQVFASGGQTIEVSASVSVLPMNTQNWSPLGWTG